MGSIIFDISNFSNILFDEALNFFQCFKVFKYYKSKKILSETKSSDNTRDRLIKRRQVRAMLVSFSIGYELLFKAVLTKHEALNISAKNVSGRPKQFSKMKNIPEILNVYGFVHSALVKADTNSYLQSEIKKNNISYIHDFSSGTLGDSLGRLKILATNNIITFDERSFLHQASQTLLDIRRNLDAHTFYGFTVTKDLNGDLTNVYLPAVNLLIDIYHRSSL